MRKVMHYISDYIFYRLYIFYTARETGGAVATSSTFLAFIQFLAIYFLVMIGTLAYYHLFQGSIIFNKMSDKLWLKIMTVIIILVLDVLNYLRYRKPQFRADLIKKFRGKSINRYFKLWMLPLVAIALFLLPILLNQLVT